SFFFDQNGQASFGVKQPEETRHNEFMRQFEEDKKAALAGKYEFIGMNQILDHPFGCKDRVVTETDYIPQRQLSFFAGISNEYGYDRIFDWLEYSKTELPLMCGILKELPEPESPKKTVYVMHMPPAGLRLGQLLYQDLDIGSVDIYEFLKAKQPLLSLHGHIHESPDTEKGSW
ncbi:metallophosphoesterase, partial [human gut metagenome]